jgi:hypothetical protein
VQVGVTAFVGAWALGAHRVERLRGRPLWVATAIAYLVVVLNVCAA